MTIENSGKYSKKRILIVEENEDFLSVLRQYFTNQNAEVMALSQIEIMGKILKDRRFDFIVCEYSMDKKSKFKQLLDLQEKYNYKPEQFIRSKTLQKEIRGYVKSKAVRSGISDSNGMGSGGSTENASSNVLPFKRPDKNLEISPTSDPALLPSIKDILNKDPLASADDSFLNFDDFLEDNFEGTLVYKVNGKEKKCGVEVLELDDLSVTCILMKISDDLKIEIGDKNLILEIQYSQNKKNHRFTFKGDVSSLEKGPFNEKLLTYKVAEVSKKELAKIIKLKAERQNEIGDFLNKVKGI